MKSLTSLTGVVVCVSLAGGASARADAVLDGKIAFVSARDGNPEIYSVNADGTHLERLTNEPQKDDEPAWSPDGLRIAFVSARSGSDQIYVMNANGSNVVQRTFFDHIDYLDPSWSPSGTQLAVAITKTVGIDTYVTTLGVMNSDGSGLTPLTKAVTSTTNSWSPDGQRIAFTSGSGNNRRISWVKADGSERGSIVSNGWNPSWKR